MLLMRLEDFNRWFDEAYALLEALEDRRGPDTWPLMRDRARHFDMAYAWARCEPTHDLDPDLTAVQALDLARRFLRTSTIMVAAAARQSGICASPLDALDTFRDPRAGQ